jgi:hypothetical protein
MAASVGDTATPLPDDVLMEIFSRAAAGKIRPPLPHSLQVVARPTLRPDPAFVRVHHRRAPRGLLLRRYNPAGGAVHNVHNAIYTLPLHHGHGAQPAPAAAPLYIDTVDRPLYLHGCCEGLLLLSHGNKPVCCLHTLSYLGKAIAVFDTVSERFLYMGRPAAARARRPARVVQDTLGAGASRLPPAAGE